jgi:hypothetical protein
MDWFLHHDNIPANSALSVKRCGAKNTTVVPHPPYSPYLLVKLLSFPKIQGGIKQKEI